MEKNKEMIVGDLILNGKEFDGFLVKNVGTAEDG
jgi:hypothetical protein